VPWAGNLAATNLGGTLELVHAFHMQTYAMPEGYVVPTPEQFDRIVHLHRCSAGSPLQASRGSRERAAYA
jgi:hypothetical protein